MKLVDGKYQQHQLGPGAQRDQRQDARAARSRAAPIRCSWSARSQAQQRAVVPAAQVGEPLGQQQLRPPGAHLPLDHGRRRRQHLGLRRDDQLVQRHAATPSARCTSARTPPRRTRCRCCTCCTPRRPAQDDRRRPALHAHRGEGRRVRAHPLRHRHRVPVRHAAPHLQERLGRQEVHQRPRLRHGQGQATR